MWQRWVRLQRRLPTKNPHQRRREEKRAKPQNKIKNTEEEACARCLHLRCLPATACSFDCMYIDLFNLLRPFTTPPFLLVPLSYSFYALKPESHPGSVPTPRVRVVTPPFVPPKQGPMVETTVMHDISTPPAPSCFLAISKAGVRSETPSATFRESRTLICFIRQTYYYL